jgi:hypothetical protein
LDWHKTITGLRRSLMPVSGQRFSEGMTLMFDPLPATFFTARPEPLTRAALFRRELLSPDLD